MNFEFDNEMDAILRKSRGVTDFAAAGDHLDADEIAAFAENAVSEASRARFTMHFADCSRCRTILANTFTAEIEQPVSVAAVAPAAAEPWYRSFFRAPQLAFGLGAVVFVFAAFVGYVAIRNIGGSGDVAVANRDEIRNAPAAVPANAPANQALPAPANAPASNSAVPNVPAPSSNSAAKQQEPPKSLNETSNGPSDSLSATRESRDEANLGDGKIQPEPAATPAPEALKKPSGEIVGGQPITEDDRERKEKSVSQENRRNADGDLGVTRSAPAMPKRQTDRPQRAVGGKNFTRVNGVWTDSAYRGQSTQMVKRGTDEYRKLDSGLRSIGDQLPGPIVVIWKDNGYRIE